MTSGMKVGYIRVSTTDQTIDRQLEDLPLDQIFTDYASGKTMDRPQLELLISFVRKGDQVYVHAMDRLARNLMHLRKIVETLAEKGVKIHFIKENLIFTGKDSPMSNLLLSMMGAFAEFEYSLIRERQKEGIAIAKAKGSYRVGRPRALNQDDLKQATQWIAEGMKKTWIAKKLKISRTVLYEYLKKMKKEKL